MALFAHGRASDRLPLLTRLSLACLVSLLIGALMTAAALRPLARDAGSGAAAQRQAVADDAARRRLLADDGADDGAAAAAESKHAKLAADLSSWETASATPLEKRMLARIVRASPSQSQPTAQRPARLSATAAVATFTRLHANLLEGYDMKAGPGNPTDVTVAMHIQRMGGVDPGLGSFETSLFLVLAWHDPRLVWTPADYDNITETALSIVPGTFNDGDLWFPDFDLRGGESLVATLATQPAAVFHDGTVVWTRMGPTTAGCTFKGLHEFPFDTLECTVRFGAMARSGHLVNYRRLAVGGSTTWALTVNPDIMSSRTFHEHWVSDYSISEETYGSEGMGGAFNDFAVYVRLKRGITGYIIVMFFPNFFLGFLSTVVYAIDNGSGERISVCVTLLLAEVASVLFVADKILFNELISTMDVFYMLVLSFTVVALLQSFWSGSLHYGNFHSAPRWFVTMKLKAVEVANDPSTWVGNYTIDKVRRRARLSAAKMHNAVFQRAARAIGAKIWRVFAAARIRDAKEQLKATEVKSAPLQKFRAVGRVAAAEAAAMPLTMRNAKYGQNSTNKLSPLEEDEGSEASSPRLGRTNATIWTKEEEMAVKIQRTWRSRLARNKIRSLTEELRRKRIAREDFNASRGLSEIGIELSKRLDMQFLFVMPPIYVALVTILLADLHEI